MINKLRNVVLIFAAILPMICISAELPDGYFAVDYIEATGTQYIDTGVTAENKRSAKGVFSFPTFPVENEWWGILSASDDVVTNEVVELYYYTLLGITHYDGAKVKMLEAGFNSPKGADNARGFIESLHTRYYCGGSYFKDKWSSHFYTNLVTGAGKGYNANWRNNQSLSNRNFYLFANNNKGIPTNFAKARLYSLSINSITERYFMDENTPLRNYVPAYSAADAAYGLYDTVAREFKKSEGSEPFLGPAVIDIGDFDENGYDCQFTGCAPGVSNPEIGMKIVISRRSGAVRHYGVVANGITNMLDGAAFEYEVTAENVNSSFRVVPCADKNWYVCNDTGSDDNSGFFENAPKKTLAAILAVATNAGDVVHAAAGTYASGEIEYDYEAYTNKYNDVSFGSDPVRCEIAAGVRLVGDAGAEATILDGSGTHRGVLLNPGAVIQGFTIQNCKINGFGGAVHGVNDDDVIADCIVEDNVSGRYSIYMVKAVFRSRFYRNSADYGPVGSKVYLYNCLIGEGNRGRYCMYQGGTLDNCTVLGKLPASRKAISFRNCLVVPAGQESGNECSWWNSSYIGKQNSADNFHEGNEQVPADEMQFVDTVGGTPVIGKNCGVDRGDESLYFANYPSHLDPVIDGANRDLFGKPRIANGKLDRGCVEADWRGEYATTLGGGSSFAVYSASSNVTNANGFVALPDGGELTAGWRVTAGMTASCSFSFRNTGAGTLYVTVNGETVAYGPSEETRTVRFCCTSAADTVSLKYEAGEDSEGCAEIFGFAGYRGLRLTIR